MMLYAFGFPLMAGLIFAIAVLTIKQATDAGMGVMRILFVSNWMFAVVFSFLLLIDCEVKDWSYWPYVVGSGVATFLASLLRIMAIRAMHVSFLTPLLGSKALFATFISVIIIGHSLPTSWWFAAGLATIALLIMGMTTNFMHHLVLKGVVYALSCSCLFAFSDVLMGKAGRSFGTMPYIVGLGWLLALQSFVLIPFFHNKLTAVSQLAWKYTLLGTFILSIQAMLLFLGVALSGEPAYVNIVYSSRGLWGIVLVWCLGFWWNNKESEIGKKAMFARAVGAVLLTVAIGLVVLSK